MHLVLFGIGLVVRHGVCQQGPQRLLVQREVHVAGQQLVHVEQVVDQHLQAQAIALGDFQHAAHGLRHFAQGAAIDQPQ